MLRQRLENLYIKVADYYIFLGKAQKAEQILLRLLDKNPLSEESNQSVLDFYIEQKNINKFMRYFENYKKILKRELNEDPVERYKSFFNKISNNNL